MADIDEQWNFNDPVGSEKKFRLLLSQMKKNSHDYLEMLTQIARAQGLQRKYQQAHKTLDKVKAASDPKDEHITLRYLLERGRVFNSAGEIAKAKPLFRDAFKSGKKTAEVGLTIDAAHMMAIVETKPTEQIRWNKLALGMATKFRSAKAKKWIPSLYNNLAWTYHDTGKFEEALKLFKKALPLREAQGVGDNIRFAKWCIARTLRSLMRYQEALQIQEELLRELKRRRTSDEDVEKEIEELRRALKN